MDIVKKLTLDVSRDKIQANVILVQGEVGSRAIAVSLRNGSVPIAFEKKHTAAVHGFRPDGAEIFNSCTVYTENSSFPNTIVYRVTEGTVAVPGTYNLRLVVWNTLGEALWSPEFSITVKENGVVDTGIGKQSEFTSLIEATKRAEEVVEEVRLQQEEHTADIEERMAQHEANLKSIFTEHEAKNDNPHGVTAEQVGLGKVDNTADKDKPVSMAQSRALADKVDKLLPTGTAKVYGMAANGTQKGFDVTADKTGGSVALRDANGTFEVSDPTKGAHPVTRTFLETIVALLVGKEGNQTIGGDLSVDGDLYVTGRTYGTDMESLNVKDAVIVANADGVPLAGLSGYVIRAGGGKAYGILYDPVEDCVKIGLGSFDGEVFVYETNEAQVLATRGEIVGGNLPVWDSEKHTFVDSGKRAEDLTTTAYVDAAIGEALEDNY